MALNALPLFHRVAGSRVVVLGQGPAAEAKRRLVERAGGACCGEPEAHHASLAFVAIDDPRAAEAAAARLRGKGLLVNVTDRPELCDFTVPSILDRDPVIVAVGTGGASAGLAKHVRLRLEQVLPQSLGQLAAALHAVRTALRERFSDARERRIALDGALSEGGTLDPFDGNAFSRVAGWIADEASVQAPGEIEILLGTDDPEDLTLREARLLGQADAIVVHGDVPEIILARARADARRLKPGADVVGNGLVVHIRRHDGQAEN